MRINLIFVAESPCCSPSSCCRDLCLCSWLFALSWLAGLGLPILVSLAPGVCVRSAPIPLPHQSVTCWPPAPAPGQRGVAPHLGVSCPRVPLGVPTDLGSSSFRLHFTGNPPDRLHWHEFRQHFRAMPAARFGFFIYGILAHCLQVWTNLQTTLLHHTFIPQK